MDTKSVGYALGAGALGWVVGKLIRREHRAGMGVTAEEYIRELREFERRLQDIAAPPRPSPPPYEPRVPQTAESLVPDMELDRLRRELCPLVDTYNTASAPVADYARRKFAAEMSRLDPFTRELVLDYLRRHCLDPNSRLLWTGGVVEFPPVDVLPPRPPRTTVTFGEPIQTYTPTTPTYYQQPPPPLPPGTVLPPGTPTIQITPRTILQPTPPTPTGPITGFPVTTAFTPFLPPTPPVYPPVATPRTVARTTPLEVPTYQTVTLPTGFETLPPVPTPPTRPSVTFGEPVRTYTPVTPTYYQQPPPVMTEPLPPGTETLQVGPRRLPVATPRTIPRTTPLEVPEYQPTTLPTGRAEPTGECPPGEVMTAQGCVPEGAAVATPSRFPGLTRLLPLVGGGGGGGIQAPSLGVGAHPFRRKTVFG